MGLPSIDLQGFVSNALNALLPTPIGNPDTSSIATDPTVQTQLQQQIAAGAIPTDVASKAAAASGQSGIGNAQSVTQALIAAKYQNKDGTSNGSMNSALLGLLTGVVSNLDPSQPTPTLTSVGEGVAATAVQGILYEWGKHDANVGKVLGSVPVGTVVSKVLQGNYAGALMSTLFGSVYDNLLDKQNTNMGQISTNRWDPRLRVPVVDANGKLVYLSSSLDSQWPRIGAPKATIQTGPGQGNVGHKGHMEVKLGGLQFELPPAVHSQLMVPGGSDIAVPGAEAGIVFKHVPNIATMLIPGSFPEYQGLGIQGHLVEFVGLFLGFEHTRRLNADLHGTGWYNDQGPDPFYTDSSNRFVQVGGQKDTSREGGAWAVSRTFQSMINQGLPQDFEIFTGVSRIKYSLLVTSFTRIYRRDDRVYYRIIGVAIGGGEDTNTARKQVAVQKKQRPNKTQATKRNNVVKAPSAYAKANPSTLKTASKTPVTKSTTIAPSPSTWSRLQTAVSQLEANVAGYISFVGGLETGSSIPSDQDGMAANYALTTQLSYNKASNLKDAVQVSLSDMAGSIPQSFTDLKGRIDAAYTKFTTAKTAYTTFRSEVKITNNNSSTSSANTPPTLAAGATSVSQKFNQAVTLYEAQVSSYTKLANSLVSYNNIVSWKDYQTLTSLGNRIQSSYSTASSLYPGSSSSVASNINTRLLQALNSFNTAQNSYNNLIKTQGFYDANGNVI